MRDIESEKIVAKLLDVLKAERKKQGLSHETLANRAGLHRSTIGLLENKKRTPTVLVALKIAKALDLKLSDLLKNLAS